MHTSGGVKQLVHQKDTEMNISFDWGLHLVSRFIKSGSIEEHL